MTDNEEQGVRSNPAIQLYDMLAALTARARSDPNGKQRDVLCDVLRVDPDETALLYRRLAELYKLPGVVLRSLMNAKADLIFAEWRTPVDEAISRLDGSAHTNLSHFNGTAELPEALVKLYMCRTQIDVQDSLEMGQLSGIRAAIRSALKSVLEAKDIDQDLSQWLQSVLREMEGVVAEAEAVGAYAARDRLSVLLGDISRRPIPRATTDKEKVAYDKVASVFGWLVKALDVSTRIAGLLSPTAGE